MKYIKLNVGISVSLVIWICILAVILLNTGIKDVSSSSAVPREVCVESIFSGQTCHVYLSNEIQDQSKYVQLITQLQLAGSKDEFHIHLWGYGGDAQTILYLADQIKATRGTVT